MGIVDHKTSHSPTARNVWLLLTLGTVALVVMHFGCQQRTTTDVTPSPILNLAKWTCWDPSWIMWTRYGGAGCFQIYLILSVIVLHMAGVWHMNMTHCQKNHENNCIKYGRMNVGH